MGAANANFVAGMYELLEMEDYARKIRAPYEEKGLIFHGETGMRAIIRSLDVPEFNEDPYLGVWD